MYVRLIGMVYTIIPHQIGFNKALKTPASVLQVLTTGGH
jgi:hypothetical protein